MNKLVRQEKKEIVTDTLIIAKGVGNHHKNVMELLNNYRHTETLSTFKTEKVSNGGRPVEYAVLNERQATFLITLMRNNEKVVEFKEKLSNAFINQREIITKLVSQQRDPNWLNVRKNGKLVVKQKTDVIKNFIQYAISQGSKSAERYYVNFAKMENQAMFIFEQKYPNMREVLTIKQLMQVATADDIIEKAIKECMDKEMYYKDIYKEAKRRIIAYVDIIGKSPILGLEEK